MDPSLLAALDAAPAWGSDESDALLADLLDDSDELLAELLPPHDTPPSPSWGNRSPPHEELQETPTTPTHTTLPSPPTAGAEEHVVTAPAPVSAHGSRSKPSALPSSEPKPITRTAKEKLKLSQLRAEATQLTRELKRLRSRDPSQLSLSSAMEIATIERRKRRRAEDECRQLRAVVYQHARFLRNLRSVFSFPPPLSQGLNLCQYLHDYVRLPRDRTTRRTEYEALSRDERLAMAVEILCRETEAISFDEPHIQTELLPSSDGFAVTTVSVYAVDTNDLSAVLRGACVAVRDIVTRWPQCEPVDVTRKIVDADEAVVADHHLMYRLVTAKHKHRESGAELSVQARATTFYKLTDHDAVMMWDFVDEDELYPVAAEPTDVTRKSIGALLMRREQCRDGHERVVCRSICTKRYTANSSCRSGVLDRFVHAAKESLRPNGRVFYEIVAQQVAEEEAIVTRHLTTTTTTTTPVY